MFHETMITLPVLEKQLYEYLLSLWKLYFGPSCCCKDSCFSFQECCCFACPCPGGRGALQRTTIANEINRNSKTDLGPMQTICFLIWSSHRRDKQGQFSERCSVFLFIKERENISDDNSNNVCWSENME